MQHRVSTVAAQVGAQVVAGAPQVGAQLAGAAQAGAEQVGAQAEAQLCFANRPFRNPPQHGFGQQLDAVAQHVAGAHAGAAHAGAQAGAHAGAHAGAAQAGAHAGAQAVAGAHAGAAQAGAQVAGPQPPTQFAAGAAHPGVQPLPWQQFDAPPLPHAAGAQLFAGQQLSQHGGLMSEQRRWYVWTVGQQGLTITGLQHAGWHVDAQPQLFAAPQPPLRPQNIPASARLAMPMAASIAPQILIHRIEQRLLPLGISKRMSRH